MPPTQPQQPQTTPTQPANGQPDWYAQSSAPAPSPAAPKRNKKRLILIIAAVAAVLVIIGVAVWYILFSQPVRAISDALINAAKSDHSTLKGTIAADLVSTDTGTKDRLTATYSGAIAKDSFKANLVASLTYNGVPLNIDGNVLATPEGEGYFKINNIRDLATQAIGDQPQALSELEPLLKLLDKKWVKLSESELNEIAPSNSQDSTLSCIQKIQTEVTNSTQLQGELFTAYAANQFITIDKTLPNEEINGVDNVHYLLKPDKQKSSDFIKAFKNTQLFKKYNDCTGGQFDKELTSDSLTSSGDTSLEVWIGRWDHTFSRIKLIGKDSDGSTTIDINTDYRSAVSIEAPTTDITPFSTLKKTYEKYLPDQSAADSDTLMTQGALRRPVVKPLTTPTFLQLTK